WRISRPPYVQISMFFCMAITIMMTVIGNIFVIISIAHFKQLHTPTNHLILSLAMCDFLLGIFVMPLSSMRSVYSCWFLSDFMCKVHTGMDIMLSTASIFHLTCVSAERFCAVCSPLTYRSRFRSATVLLLVSASWVFSAAFAYAMVFGELNLKGSEDFYESNMRCVGGCHVFFSHGSAVVTSMVSFFIPGLIIFAIYSRIYIVARSQARSINILANQLRMHSPKPGVFRYRTRKGTMTLAIVVGVFLICWTPFFLCNIIDPFVDYAISPVLIDALVWFGYLNSALNPFIYAFLYPWFRKALKIIVKAQNSCLLEVEDLIEYCYPESNVSCVKISHNVVAKTVLYSVLVFAMAITILGNSVVIISIMHFKQLHTPTNILVMSLALVDLLLGITVMPFSMLRTVDGCWYFGKEYCYWHSNFDFLFTGASIFHLIFIAIDRYHAVCYPLQYPTRITLPVAGLMAALSWILATVYAFSTVGTKANEANLEEYIAAMDCFGNCSILVNIVCASICTTFFFILPICVMIGLYAQIFLVSEKHAKKMEGTKQTRADMNSNKILQKVKHEKKAAKTLGIVVGAFNLCWMPYFITSVVDPLYNFTTPGIIYELFVWLGYINSTLNPIIYGLFYPWFRK
ncbi:trace amine-associated receptor 1, partial [Silurus meridionalis]